MSTYRSRGYTVQQKSTKDMRYSHNAASYRKDDIAKFVETVRLWQNAERARNRLLNSNSNTDPARMAVEIIKINEAVKNGPAAKSCVTAWALLNLDNALDAYSLLSEKGLHDLANELKFGYLGGRGSHNETKLALIENRKSEPFLTVFVVKQIEYGFGVLMLEKDTAQYQAVVDEIVHSIGKQGRYGDLAAIVKALAKEEFGHFEARRAANRVANGIIEKLGREYDEFGLARELKKECGEALGANPVKAFAKKVFGLYAKDDFYNAKCMVITLHNRLTGSSRATEDFECFCLEIAMLADKEETGAGKRILLHVLGTFQVGADIWTVERLQGIWKKAYPDDEYPYSHSIRAPSPRNYFREIIERR